jgi:menaquinol-cytochrome c reductase cytochrome b/c subunit
MSVKDPRLYWDYQRGRKGSTSLRDRRARHNRYKEDVEKRGKAFFPHAMFHDTVMSLIVVSVIIALACIWYFDSTEAPGADGAGVLGPRYTEEADPGTINFVPRPDWYFYFLFYLLRIFKWPDTVVLGTVGVPTILLIFLFALPFIDRRRERRISRRPVAVVTAVLVVISMGVLTYRGAVAEEGIASNTEELVDDWMTTYNLPEEVRPGAELFAETGCTNCHVYGNVGASVGPELTEIGTEGRGVDYFVRYITNPRDFDNTVMPVYGDLGEEPIRQMAEFLEASKGEGG